MEKYIYRSVCVVEGFFRPEKGARVWDSRPRQNSCTNIMVCMCVCVVCARDHHKIATTRTRQSSKYRSLQKRLYKATDCGEFNGFFSSKHRICTTHMRWATPGMRKAIFHYVDPLLTLSLSIYIYLPLSLILILYSNLCVLKLFLAHTDRQTGSFIWINIWFNESQWGPFFLYSLWPPHSHSQKYRDKK